jgi:trimeric autotransporter adhesin
VPSLDLVIYKMGGNSGQYDPTLTDVPQPEPNYERDDWKPIQVTPFVEGSRGGDDGIRRVLEMCAWRWRQNNPSFFNLRSLFPDAWIVSSTGVTTMNTKFKCLAALLLSIVDLQLSICFAQNTAFTYQGRFTDNGTPFTGTAEMQFTLWDAVSNGTQVATMIPASAFVTVSNGLFTVPIDFGAAAFTGADRWIQIDARTVIGPFTALQPRQKVTSTPYAIRAANLTGTLPSNQLAGTYGNAVTFSNAGNMFVGTFTGTLIGNGAGLTNVGAATIGGFTANELWKTSGNAGTVAGLNFLGTTDNQPMELKVNGQRVVRWERQTNAPVFGFVIPNIIGGFESNTVPNGVGGATIAGGGGPQWYGPTMPHIITGSFSTIGGGVGNAVNSVVGTIAGGERGTLSFNAYNSFLGGGAWNTIDSPDSTIGGGRFNAIHSNGYVSTISGGANNSIQLSTSYGSIGGGYLNSISGNYGVVPGGDRNTATANSFAAGRRAKALHTGSFVWGDATEQDIVSTGTNQFVARASGGVRFITGGAGALLDGMPFSKEYAVPNDLSYSNIVNVIHGSPVNFVTNGVVGATISGGGAGYYFNAPFSNSVLGNFSTIAGGLANKSGSPGGWYATVGGGANNSANGSYTTVAGGSLNLATGEGATVGGGAGNTASGDRATVPGGQVNTAAGLFSFAAGSRARANHNGTFVWGDAQDAYVSSTGDNQFLIRAAGGVGINTPSPGAALHVAGGARFDGDVSLQGGYRRIEMSGGNSLGFFYGSYPYFGDGVHVGYNFYADGAGGPHPINTGAGTSRVTAGYGEVVLAVGNPGFGPNNVRLVANSSGVTVYGTFNNLSDRNAKQDFEPVNAARILEKVTHLPLTKWSYKDDPNTRHIGPMAQDFQATFNVGTDEKHIAPIDEGGVALAAIQGLNEKVEQQRAENAELKRELAELKKLVSKLLEQP